MVTLENDEDGELYDANYGLKIFIPSSLSAEGGVHPSCSKDEPSCPIAELFSSS